MIRNVACAPLVRVSVAAILGTAVGFSYGTPAFAAAPAEEELAEIQVTGSRIRRATDFDTANPTTVVDESFFDNLGIVNVGDAIKALPSNISNNSPATTGNANFFAGSTIANLRGLNPFFGSRTLNLVNGRRHVPTNQGDGVDLNFIPSVLIERMDVVTGGASAAYGSGAISGVNNIFLNRSLEGAKVELDYGQSQRKDARDRHIAGAFGSSFSEGRGHFSIGLEGQDSDALGCIDARDWCALNANLIAPPVAGMHNGTAWVGGPGSVLRYNVSSPVSNAGVFANAFTGPVAQVNAAGNNILPFRAGVGSQVFYGATTGGDGRPANYYTNLRSPVKRAVAAGTLKFNFTDTVTLTADASWGEVKSTNRTGALDSGGFFDPAIAADNAYAQLNPALLAVITANPGVHLVKDWTSQLDSYSTFDTEVKRISVGLDGRFGGSSWTWDSYAQYGESERTQWVNDNRHLNAYNLAQDAVFDDRDAALPMAARRIECRVTQQLRNGSPAAPAAGSNLYNIAQGCVPINPFGTGPLDAAVHDYAFGFLHEQTTVKQTVLAFNTTGDLAAGFGAGSIKGAVGVEFRREKGENLGLQGDKPDYVRTDYLIQYGESFAGTVDVIEGYLETSLPLLRDVPGARRLELDLAGRYSSYDNKGTLGPGDGISRTNDMFTWKVSGIWDPVEAVRVRFSQSRDSRAANFRELYYGQIIQAGGAFGFCTPTGAGPFAIPDPCTWSLEGNVDLKPEKADTTTVGLVFQPRELLPGFEFAADYFRIKIKDAIQQANVARVREGCQLSGLQEFCNLITPDAGALPTPGASGNYNYNPATGVGIERLRALSFNGSAYLYRGIDFSGSYTFRVGDADTLSLRLLATRMLEQSFTPVPGQPTVDVIGQTGTANAFLPDNQPSAKWNSNLSLTWMRGSFTSTLNVRHIGKGIKNYIGVDPTDADFASAPSNWVRLEDNTVGSYTVFGLNANYRWENKGFAKSIDLWGNVSNLFDRDPPIVGGGQGGTNAIFFDTLGRYYKIGLRASF